MDPNQDCNVLKSRLEIHVWRMREAVIWSAILQFILLFTFILATNVDILHPLTWLGNFFHIFLQLDVWLKFCILVIIVYIQGEVCKKDYVNGSVYYSTRFRKIRHIFSIRNLLLLLLHMVIGVTIFWIYSSVSGGKYKTLTIPCKDNAFPGSSDYCLVERKLFLLFAGLWLGVYYFSNDYMFGSRNLSFPLIQQSKLYRIKAVLKEHIKKTFKYSILPTATFIVIYYIYGGFVRQIMLEFLNCRMDVEPIDSIQGLINVELILSLWVFSSVFIVALKIMELLFNIYLTENHVFPVTTTMLPTGNHLRLIDSMKTSNVPIIHHLGYLDLFTVSTKSHKRREEIFALSHPGGHPHTWNGIFQESSNLIKKFTSDLNHALEQSASSENELRKRTFQPEISSFHFHSHKMRNLASPLVDANTIIGRPAEYQSAVEVVFNNFQSWFSSKLEEIKRKPLVAYFFIESPDSRINYLLCQSQPIIWAVESLTFLSAASLNEDRYGIIQRDLPDIVVTIVSLKQAMDKLFKHNLIVKKSFANEPNDVQMKYLLRNSVKRSLYKIAVTFGPYIKDLRLPTDVEVQMNNFITFKEV